MILLDCYCALMMDVAMRHPYSCKKVIISGIFNIYNSFDFPRLKVFIMNFLNGFGRRCYMR